MTTLYRCTEDLQSDMSTMDSVCFCESYEDAEGYSMNHGGCDDVVEVEYDLRSMVVADEADVLEYADDCRMPGAQAWELMDEPWVRRDMWDRGFRAARYTDCGHADGETTSTVRIMLSRAPSHQNVWAQK